MQKRSSSRGVEMQKGDTKSSRQRDRGKESNMRRGNREKRLEERRETSGESSPESSYHRILQNWPLVSKYPRFLKLKKWYPFSLDNQLRPFFPSTYREVKKKEKKKEAHL